jgi:hypothetical protein
VSDLSSQHNPSTHDAILASAAPAVITSEYEAVMRATFPTNLGLGHLEHRAAHQFALKLLEKVDADISFEDLVSIHDVWPELFPPHVKAAPTQTYFVNLIEIKRQARRRPSRSLYRVRPTPRADVPCCNADCAGSSPLQQESREGRPRAF